MVIPLKGCKGLELGGHESSSKVFAPNTTYFKPPRKKMMKTKKMGFFSFFFFCFVLFIGSL